MGETSLGIEYADPSTRPCDVPDVLYRGFDTVASLVDGLDGQADAIDNPVMLHVSWQPTPGQATQLLGSGGPIRWNTVNVNNGGMFNPQASDFQVQWNHTGYQLWLASVQLVNPAPANPSWELSTSFEPSPFSGFVVPLLDYAYDAGVAAAPTTSDQWLSMCTMWRIDHNYLGFATHLTVSVVATVQQDIEIAHADLVVLKMGEL